VATDRADVVEVAEEVVVDEAVTEVIPVVIPVADEAEGVVVAEDNKVSVLDIEL
jgi:hypothetical protein